MIRSRIFGRLVCASLRSRPTAFKAAVLFFFVRPLWATSAFFVQSFPNVPVFHNRLVQNRPSTTRNKKFRGLAVTFQLKLSFIVEPEMRHKVFHRGHRTLIGICDGQCWTAIQCTVFQELKILRALFARSPGKVNQGKTNSIRASDAAKNVTWKNGAPAVT